MWGQLAAAFASAAWAVVMSCSSRYAYMHTSAYADPCIWSSCRTRAASLAGAPATAQKKSCTREKTVFRSAAAWVCTWLILLLPRAWHGLARTLAYAACYCLPALPRGTDWQHTARSDEPEESTMSLTLWPQCGAKSALAIAHGAFTHPFDSMVLPLSQYGTGYMPCCLAVMRAAIL